MNEHFEAVFDVAGATQIVNKQLDFLKHRKEKVCCEPLGKVSNFGQNGPRFLAMDINKLPNNQTNICQLFHANAQFLNVTTESSICAGRLPSY